MRLKYIVFVFALFLALPHGEAAQQISQKKRIVRTYKVNPATRVEVINKYGKVEIIHWDKDSVKYVINLETKAKSKDKIDKLEAMLNFNFQGGEGYIRAQTILGEESNDLMSEINNLTKAIFSIGAEVVIDYTVYMPSSNKLKIINSFGDIFMGNFNPNLHIELSHGDLRVGKLNSFSIINVKFGKAFVGYLKEGKINLLYADLMLSSVNKLDIESKLSTVEIDDANIINIDSKKDDYKIGSLNSLKGRSNFSKIYIARFNNEMNMALKYGSFNLGMISSLFHSINLTSNYTEMSMVFESGTGYNFSLTQSDMEFNYPKERGVLKEELIDKDKKQYYYSGRIGETDKDSKVTIVSDKGSLKIFHN